MLRWDDPPQPSLTDWARIRAMTEDDIELAALSDPDSVPYLTEEQRLSELAALHARLAARRAAE